MRIWVECSEPYSKTDEIGKVTKGVASRPSQIILVHQARQGAEFGRTRVGGHSVKGVRRLQTEKTNATVSFVARLKTPPPEFSTCSFNRIISSSWKVLSNLVRLPQRVCRMVVLFSCTGIVCSAGLLTQASLERGRGC